MVSSTIPTKEGFVFDGWYFEEGENTYDPYDVIAFDDVVNYAVWNSKEAVSELTLYAKWIPEDEADTVYYNVNVYFEKDEGGYPDQADIQLSESAVPGKAVYVMTEKLLDSIKEDENAPANIDEYEIDEGKSTLYVEEVTSGSNINIYYKFHKYHITTSVHNGNITPSGDVRKGKDFKVEYSANNG